MTTNNSEYQRKYMLRYRKIKRNRVVQQLGGRCVKCFSIKTLEIHHLIPVIHKNSDTFSHMIKSWSEDKTKNNLLLECETCHDYRNGNGPSLILKSGLRITNNEIGTWTKHRDNYIIED